MLVVLAAALVLAAAVGATGAVLAAQWLTVRRATIVVNVRRAAYRVVTPSLPRRVRRFADLVGERVRPGGVFGLRLAAGLFAVTALSVLFGALMEDVAAGEGIAMIDHPVARFVAAHRSSGLTTVMKAISFFGSPIGVAVFALICACVVSAVRRTWSPVLLVASGTGGIAVIDTALKALVGRSRPPMADAVDAAAGWAFPSGHAASATATLALLAYLVTRTVQRTATNAASWAAAASGAVLVSISRVYLGVHWLSDVLGGMLVGALWAAVVVTTWSVYRGSAGQHGIRRTRAARVPQAQ